MPGELLNDEFGSYPLEHTVSLAPSVLHYWGLLATPFAVPQLLSQPPQNNDFYFRSESHVGAWTWLQNLVLQPACFGILRVSSGAGTATLLRHLSTTSGLGETAVEITTAQWGDQSMARLTEQLSQTADVDSANGVRALWMIEAASTSTAYASLQRANVLMNWYQTHACRLSNLTVVMVIRKQVDTMRLVSNVTQSIPTYYLHRVSTRELGRCVGVALRHAGSTRPAFTVAATEHLAEAAAGSIGRLGRLVHTALLHGYFIGVRQISRTDLGSRLTDEPNTSSSVAQNRAA